MVCNVYFLFLIIGSNFFWFQLCNQSYQYNLNSHTFCCNHVKVLHQLCQYISLCRFILFEWFLFIIIHFMIFMNVCCYMISRYSWWSCCSICYLINFLIKFIFEDVTITSDIQKNCFHVWQSKHLCYRELIVKLCSNVFHSLLYIQWHWMVLSKQAVWYCECIHALSQNV